LLYEIAEKPPSKGNQSVLGQKLAVVSATPRKDAEDDEFVLGGIVLESDAPLAGSEAVFVGAGEFANIGAGVAFGKVLDCENHTLRDLVIQSAQITPRPRRVANPPLGHSMPNSRLISS